MSIKYKNMSQWDLWKGKAFHQYCHSNSSVYELQFRTSQPPNPSSMWSGWQDLGLKLFLVGTQSFAVDKVTLWMAAEETHCCSSACQRSTRPLDPQTLCCSTITVNPGKEQGSPVLSYQRLCNPVDKLILKLNLTDWNTSLYFPSLLPTWERGTKEKVLKNVLPLCPFFVCKSPKSKAMKYFMAVFSVLKIIGFRLKIQQLNWFFCVCVCCAVKFAICHKW